MKLVSTKITILSIPFLLAHSAAISCDTQQMKKLLTKVALPCYRNDQVKILLQLRIAQMKNMNRTQQIQAITKRTLKDLRVLDAALSLMYLEKGLALYKKKHQTTNTSIA